MITLKVTLNSLQVLEALEIYPEDEFQLKGLFDQLDHDRDGYVSIEDFEQNLIASLQTDSGQEVMDFLTRAKLEEIKKLVKGHSRLDYAFISDMRTEVESHPDKFEI